jgi:anti-sigma B factor antagonist
MPVPDYEYILVRYVDGVAIVGFRETMSMFEGDKVEAVGKELINLVATGKEPKILVNLSNAHFVSSAMLANLVKMQRRVQEAKGKLKLCGLRPVIMDAFKIARFDRLFEIHPDENSALSKF